MDVIQVIDALGGTSAAARELGVKPNTVTNWKNRGRIPAEVILNNPKLAIQYLAEKNKELSRSQTEDKAN